jgi:hypothetical protein
LLSIKIFVEVLSTMAVSDIKEFSKPIRKGIVDRGWLAVS